MYLRCRFKLKGETPIKKSLIIFAIFALFTYVACATTPTDQTLTIKNTVSELDTNTIRVAYSTSAITLTRTATTFGDATITGGTDISTTSTDTSSFKAEEGDEIYIAICNAQDTNLKKGNNKIGDVDVTVETTGWILTESNVQITSPANEQKNTITLSAIYNCSLSADKITGKITWVKGRQLAASSFFT